MQERNPPVATGGSRQNNKNPGPLFCTNSAEKSNRSRASRQLEILAIRALELADQVAARELRFQDAVDLAYEAAVWSGLVETVGDDVVQLTLAAAFANARKPA